MKTLTLLLCLFASLAPLARAAGKAPTTPPPQGTLPLVIVETLQRRSSAITDFDRLDMAFQRLAKQRKWPLKVAAERFAANVPDYTTELRIRNQPLRRETPGDLVFRGWTTVMVDGKEHDLGIIFHRAYPRFGENMDDALQDVFDGAAREIADKVEPILFPKAK